MSDDLVNRARACAAMGTLSRGLARELAARIEVLEADLLAADELARAVDAHSNEFDMTVEDALAAYRARRATGGGG